MSKSNKEDFTENKNEAIKIEGRLRNEFIYLAALSLLRGLYEKGVADLTVLERINQKNAEKMECVPIGIR